MIDFRTFPEIVEVAAKYKQLRKKAVAYETSNKAKWGKAIEESANFSHNTYARTVYETLLSLNPTMIDSDTGNKISFIDAFGRTWEDVVARRLQIIYMLAEDSDRQYQILEKCISVNGVIKDTICIMNPATRRRDIIIPREE